MTTLRERARAIYNLLEIASADFKGGIGCEDCELDRIERHLREAVEEALHDERGGRVMNPGGTIVHLPDAADALKAVAALCHAIRFEEDVYPIEFACHNILKGNRDGDAAKAIIGEEQNNHKVK